MKSALCFLYGNRLIGILNSCVSPFGSPADVGLALKVDIYNQYLLIVEGIAVEVDTLDRKSLVSVQLVCREIEYVSTLLVEHECSSLLLVVVGVILIIIVIMHPCELSVGISVARIVL